MKKIVRRIVSWIATLVGREFIAKALPVLARHIAPEDFQRGFGFPREVLQVTPGHYYSVIPDVEAVRGRYDELMGKPTRGVHGIKFRVDEQYRLAAQLGPLFADFPYSFDQESQSVRGEINGRAARYISSARNQTFHLDAVVLQAMLRHFQPERIIEVGSGYSSAIMLDTRERYGWTAQELIFIEPYSQEYFFPLLRDEDRSRIQLIESPLWEVGDEVFKQLQSGDLLFIDSSHVAKIGSDVYHYLFNILPILNSGVIVHIHDVTTWFEMAPAWFERGWYWNEGQFLRAFLMYNSEFEVVYHSSSMCWEHQEAPGVGDLRAHMDKTFKLPETQWTGSFYMRRR